jgi:hypothetical protein
LIKTSREHGVTGLRIVAEEINQGGLLTSARLTEENVLKIGLRCVTCYSAFTACLLAGVTSENPKFANQLSWIDSILNQTEWPTQGQIYWVEMPELILFTLQALVGGNLMQTNNIETAFKLATTSIKTLRDTEADPLFKQANLTGWPNSLGHKCSVSFTFLNSVIDGWSWLSEVFGSSAEAHATLTAYYFLLGFLDLISLLKSKTDLGSQLIVTVPLNFYFGSKETQQAGYRLFLSNREFLLGLLEKNDISKSTLESSWPPWMRQTAALIGPWGFNYAPANANFPKDIFADPSDL